MKLILLIVVLFDISAEFTANSQELIPVNGVIPYHVSAAYHANLTKTSIRSRIVNGLFAKSDQFPYITWFYIYTALGDLYVCGGSLITRNFVLSAAHCFYGDVGAIEVYLGSINRNAFPTKVAADAYVINSAFSFETFEYDISLVRLKLSVMHPVATLPTRRMVQLTFNSYGYIVQAAGWGITETGSTSQYLKYANLTTVPVSNCFMRSTNQICTKVVGAISAGPGDSGGPLIYNDVLVGIVSFGRYVTEDLRYDGFTRIAPYLDWIASHTAVKILD